MSAAELRAKLDRFPRLGLAHLPTPLHPLRQLTAHLGGPDIWCKRDDLTGLGTGGNKLRKIDYALHAALDGGADCIVSGGVGQSNSARQVAAACAASGVPCHLVVLEGRTEPASELYHSSGNARLAKLFGATRHHRPWSEDPNAVLSDLADELRADGHNPAILPYGVSATLGTIGYVSAALEIAEQMDRPPDAVVFASGSGGTHAGLALGGAAAMPETKIIGFDIDAKYDAVMARVEALGRSAGHALGIAFDPTTIDLRRAVPGAAYGVASADGLAAMHLAGRLEGLVLDPTYSAKSLAGLIKLVESGELCAGQRVVFVHTGGDAAIFAYESGALGL